MKANPQLVSRILRKAGYGVVVSFMREGLRVSRSGNGACVSAQFDSAATQVRRIIEVRDFLIEQGFNVTLDGGCVHVTAKEG